MAKVGRVGIPMLGVSKITLLVFTSIFGAVLYVGFSIGPFFYDYYELENQMQAVIKLAAESNDADIRRRVIGVIKELGIPANLDKLRIERDSNRMKIYLPYEEVFYLTWQGKDHDIYVFKFEASAEGRF